METVVERPGALDVHKEQVTACVRVHGAGGSREPHVAEFPTTVLPERRLPARRSGTPRVSRAGREFARLGCACPHVCLYVWRLLRGPRG